LVLSLDVLDPAALSGAVEAAVARFGRLDVLINNAGYGEMGPIEEMTAARWRKQFETNVYAPALLARAAAAHMRGAGGGRILNVSSAGGEFTSPFAGAYHASKYALESLSDALRVELAPFGIQVVLVQPGPVRTPLAAASIEALATSEASPYATALTGFRERSAAQAKRGLGFVSADDVARVLLTAATARRVRARYKVGLVAHLMPWLRRVLPTPAWDWAMRTMVGLPRADALHGSLPQR
jgi:NAD(P)-dependent dehydrogenase (short-subunit alcohol dehydrogenase family)